MNDAGYAILGVGVILGGHAIAKAALDEFLDKDAAKKRKEEKAARLPLSKADKAIQFVILSVSIGSLSMKLYDWATTGKQPDLTATL